MCSIGGGLVAGKEGPFIQCGSSIAWLISSWAASWNDRIMQRKQSTTTTGRRSSCSTGRATSASREDFYAADREQDSNSIDKQQHLERERWWQQGQHDRLALRQHHDAAAMGAGAGVAGAFIAPLAGAGYAVEDAATQYSNIMLAMVMWALIRDAMRCHCTQTFKTQCVVHYDMVIADLLL